MMFFVIKILASALVVAAVSEIAKRSGFWGGVIASLPVVSLLAFVWLYMETKDAGKIAQLSTSIFWLVLASLPLFLALPALIKRGLGFFPSLGLSCGLAAVCYIIIVILQKRFIINL